MCDVPHWFGLIGLEPLTRRCCACKQVKPVEEFCASPHWRTRCRSCKLVWDAKDRAKRKAKRGPGWEREVMGALVAGGTPVPYRKGVTRLSGPSDQVIGIESRGA